MNEVPNMYIHTHVRTCVYIYTHIYTYTYVISKKKKLNFKDFFGNKRKYYSYLE